MVLLHVNWLLIRPWNAGTCRFKHKFKAASAATQLCFSCASNHGYGQAPADATDELFQAQFRQVWQSFRCINTVPGSPPRVPRSVLVLGLVSCTRKAPLTEASLFNCFQKSVQIWRALGRRQQQRPLETVRIKPSSSRLPGCALWQIAPCFASISSSESDCSAALV